MADEEQRTRILYLDDSPAALSSVEAALDPAVYAFQAATSLGEALPWVNRSDIVIVDFHMPGMDGIEALARMRAHVRGSAPMFYLYTTDTAEAVKFKSHGFDGAFTDKGNPHTLVSKLATAARLLKMSRLRQGR